MRARPDKKRVEAGQLYSSIVEQLSWLVPDCKTFFSLARFVLLTAESPSKGGLTSLFSWFGGKKETIEKWETADGNPSTVKLVATLPLACTAVATLFNGDIILSRLGALMCDTFLRPCILAGLPPPMPPPLQSGHTWVLPPSTMRPHTLRRSSMAPPQPSTAAPPSTTAAPSSIIQAVPSNIAQQDQSWSMCPLARELLLTPRGTHLPPPLPPRKLSQQHSVFLIDRVVLGGLSHASTFLSWSFSIDHIPHSLPLQARQPPAGAELSG